MDEKISLDAISLYGDAYAGKVLKGFFTSKEKITGQEILSLCNIQQVNFFIIRELFRSWKEETHKLKSEYFDYDHPEVKDALDNLMGTLSQHIAISQSSFSPLLKKAVSQTLLVIFDPYDFFSMLVTGNNNTLEVNRFREEIKYLKVNKAPLERLLQRLDEKNIQEIQGNEAFALLDQILEEVNFTPEDVEDYIEKFSAVAPLDLNSFYVTKAQEQKIIDPIKLPPPLEIKLEAPRNLPKANVPREAQPSPTVNDRQINKPRPSVADNFQKIARIKDSLTINQKFMFTKVLFHGDFELFSKAIDDLDRQDNIKGALRYLEDNYEDWDQESEEFHEFMELVEKRFS
jgi:hypothetical protein